MKTTTNKFGNAGVEKRVREYNARIAAGEKVLFSLSINTEPHIRAAKARSRDRIIQMKIFGSSTWLTPARVSDKVGLPYKKSASDGFRYDRAEAYWINADKSQTVFYDRNTRFWIAQNRDAQGFQIGPAGYGPSKEGALDDLGKLQTAAFRI